MSVVGPFVTCHKCGRRVNITGDGRLPVHDLPNTTIPCLGSLEKPKP